tara:strand:+ start:374 stop:823 length:450 start_codon:yes stop_codon:yes gene_type:complete
MRHLGKYIAMCITGIILYSCAVNSTNNAIKNKSKVKEKPVVIANDSLEYEIIIFDIGFNTWLNSIAQPMGYYSQQYMENLNKIYVTTWNNRVMTPSQYDPQIFNNIINYEFWIDYGLEVNYKLFNYFLFAQRKYKMRLDNGVGPSPRIR